ncbi:MAG: esterase/lipase family protein [Marmoricola sp.]
MRRSLTFLACVAMALSTTFAVSGPASAHGKYPVSYNFLTSAAVAGTQMNANAPGSNIWTCKPSKAHPRPVVLVHGLTGNKNTNWQTYAPLLANNGYCVFALTYGVPAGTPPGLDQFGGRTKMETSAKQLATFVTRVRKATGAAKVDILGHSEGTVMPDYYAKFLGGARYIHSYVSLAPIWHGTALGSLGQQRESDKAYGAPSAGLPGCGACTELGTGSAFIKKLRKGGPAVSGIHYTNIVTKYDELVLPYTSGIQSGMTNITVQDKCATDYSEHFEIVADPVAAGYVLNALDPAHPRPVPCEVVLPFEGPAPAGR